MKVYTQPSESKLWQVLSWAYEF